MLKILGKKLRKIQKLLHITRFNNTGEADILLTNRLSVETSPLCKGLSLILLKLNQETMLKKIKCTIRRVREHHITMSQTKELILYRRERNWNNFNLMSSVLYLRGLKRLIKTNQKDRFLIKSLLIWSIRRSLIASYRGARVQTSSGESKWSGRITIDSTYLGRTPNLKGVTFLWIEE